MLFSFVLSLFILDQNGIHKYTQPEITDTNYFIILWMLCPTLTHMSSLIWKSFELFWAKNLLLIKKILLNLISLWQ